ncbi:MAG: relaxase/mobilization nuclease domain-containing protein [Alphaproteobacteria bacterium]
MTARDDDVRVRPGRIRNRSGGGPKTFVAQVLRAANKAGGTGQGRGAPRRGRSSFGRGRIAFSHRRLLASGHRVVIKARIVRGRSRQARAAPLATHMAYLRREGVTRDGARAHMFDAESDAADHAGFAARCTDDRHHFRFIVSPEDAAEMTDLKAFTRDLVGQMEHDLGTKLDWVAVDHWNTDNPHVHLLVRGVADDGSDLVIARDYISHGLRSRAEDLVTIELGPKPEHALRSDLEREVDAERWTRLDVEIRMATDETGFIDLRPADAGDPQIRRLMIGRLQRLERMGLATPAGPAQWMVGLEAERTLRDLGVRGDIIKTMHRAFLARGQERALGDYVIEAGDGGSPIIGRLVDTGLHDELTGAAYAVIDATDGRAHHVRLPGVAAFAHAPPAGGIVELRRLGNPDDQRPTLVLAARSDLDLPAQVTAPGATWLDHRLVAREPAPLAMGGFGAEVRSAMEARTDHLVAEGLARRQGQLILFARNLLETLRRRELEAAGARLAAETGLPHVPVATDERVAGVYRQRISLSSGRFAMIDDGLGFSLVPWSPSLERRLGRQVSGIARADGGIDWSFGRRRGLGL